MTMVRVLVCLVMGAAGFAAAAVWGWPAFYAGLLGLLAATSAWYGMQRKGKGWAAGAAMLLLAVGAGVRSGVEGEMFVEIVGFGAGASVGPFAVGRLTAVILERKRSASSL